MRRAVGLTAGLVLLIAVVWAVVYFTPFMAVKHVAVEGNAHLTQDEVVSAANVQEGTPLAQVNLRDTASGVASLPWVKSATASRKWPSTVKVTVDENVPVAFVKDSAGTHLLDAEGKEFATDTPPPGTAEIKGSSDEAARKGAVDIAGNLSEQARDAVESIEARGKNDFVLHLTEGRTVIWGASEDNKNKSLALDTVLQREGTEFNVTNPHLVTSK